MAHYNANCLCVHCKHMRPALDPNIQKAYLGKCMKREWPFTLAITLQGWTECDVFEESGQKYVPPDPATAKVVAAAATALAAAGSGGTYFWPLSSNTSHSVQPWRVMARVNGHSRFMHFPRYAFWMFRSNAGRKCLQWTHRQFAL